MKNKSRVGLFIYQTITIPYLANKNVFYIKNSISILLLFNSMLYRKIYGIYTPTCIPWKFIELINHVVRRDTLQGLWLVPSPYSTISPVVLVSLLQRVLNHLQNIITSSIWCGKKWSDRTWCTAAINQCMFTSIL